MLLEAEGGYEAASHQPFEGGDWRERHPTQMARPSPIVTFNHKWGHDALEDTGSTPARIPWSVSMSPPRRSRPSSVVHVDADGGEG